MRSETDRTCSRRSCLPRSSSMRSSSKDVSKWSSIAFLPRPVTMTMRSIPASRASSTTYWMSGRSTSGSISFGCALVAGRNRVPRPAAGKTATRIFGILRPQREAWGRSGRCGAPPRTNHGVTFASVWLRWRRFDPAVLLENSRLPVAATAAADSVAEGTARKARRARTITKVIGNSLRRIRWGLALLVAASSLVSAATARAAAWWRLPVWGAEVRAFALDPFEAGVLYCGTSRGNFYVSRDSGATWEPLKSGPAFPGYYATGLAVDPGAPGRLWASLAGELGGGLV